MTPPLEDRDHSSSEIVPATPSASSTEGPKTIKEENEMEMEDNQEFDPKIKGESGETGNSSFLKHQGGKASSNHPQNGDVNEERRSPVVVDPSSPPSDTRQSQVWTDRQNQSPTQISTSDGAKTTKILCNGRANSPGIRTELGSGPAVRKKPKIPLKPCLGKRDSSSTSSSGGTVQTTSLILSSKPSSENENRLKESQENRENEAKASCLKIGETSGSDQENMYAPVYLPNQQRPLALNSTAGGLPKCKFWTTGRGPQRSIPPDPLTPDLLKQDNSENSTASPAGGSFFGTPRYSSMSNMHQHIIADQELTPNTESSANLSPPSSTAAQRPIYGANTIARPPGRSVPKRYQRTRSFDDSCLPGALSAPMMPGGMKAQYASGYGQLNLNFPPPLYSAPYQAAAPSAFYTNPYNGAAKLSEQSTVFRNFGAGPTSDYCANSYIGWHQNYNAPPRYRSHTGFDPGLSPDPMGGMGHTSISRNNFGSTWSMSRPQMDSLGSGPFSSDPFGASAVYENSALPFAMTGSNNSTNSNIIGPTRDSRYKRNRWKLGVILGILIIIIAVLIAMGVAVYTQVKTQNSVIKLVRQYRGYFVVTEGDQLDFSAQLLNTESQEFRDKALIFQKKIDGLFELSGLNAIYEGCEVTLFRFVVAIPAMEVHFKIKTKVNVNLSSRELLTVMDDGIRKNVGDLFTDSKIDLNTLTLEDQTLSDQ